MMPIWAWAGLLAFSLGGFILGVAVGSYLTSRTIERLLKQTDDQQKIAHAR